MIKLSTDYCWNIQHSVIQAGTHFNREETLGSLSTKFIIREQYRSLGKLLRNFKYSVKCTLIIV